MEIDFLGLHSKNSSYNLIEQQKLKADRDFKDSGGDISLSLSSSSPLDFQTHEFPRFREKKTWKFPLEKMISTYKENAPIPRQPFQVLVPSSLRNPSSTGDYLYNLNHKSTIFRNTFELPTQSVSLAILGSVPVYSFPDISAQKADHNMYMAGNVSPDDARKRTRGYTPTVAMARSATLARFLEKRLHRLTQPKKSHLMGRSLNVTEACNMKVLKCNNRKKKKSINIMS